MSEDAWRALTTFAVLAATVACFAAVSLHALEVQAGYDLARAQRDGRRLGRDLCEAEQAVATRRSPAVLRAAAIALGLDVEYPRRAYELSGDAIQYYRDAVDVERAVVVKVGLR